METSLDISASLQSVLESWGSGVLIQAKQCLSSRVNGLAPESEGKQAKSRPFLLPCLCMWAATKSVVRIPGGSSHLKWSDQDKNPSQRGPDAWIIVDSRCSQVTNQYLPSQSESPHPYSVDVPWRSPGPFQYRHSWWFSDSQNSLSCCPKIQVFRQGLWGSRGAAPATLHWLKVPSVSVFFSVVRPTHLPCPANMPSIFSPLPGCMWSKFLHGLPYLFSSLLKSHIIRSWLLSSPPPAIFLVPLRSLMCKSSQWLCKRLG